MKNIFKHLKTDQNGVTLIEIIIVMGLLATLLVVVSTIFTSAVDLQQQSNSYSATNASGRFIEARLNYDIEHAVSVNVPSGLGVTTTTLVMSLDGITNSYALSGNDFKLTDTTGTDNLNSDDVIVSNVNFQELGNIGGMPIIDYSFTLTSVAKSHGRSVIETFNSTTGLQ